jgi:predicted RNA binding protein YcfA (HicA-like mRNA interferase family)
LAARANPRCHRQYKHPSRPGKVTIAGKPRDTLHPKTLASIFKQAGIEKQ